MSKDSYIQQASAKVQRTRVVQSDIADLCERWNALEARLTRLLGDETHAHNSDNKAIAGEKLREVHLSEIQTEQSHLLKTLSEAQATSASDVFVKLAVWKSIACPDDESGDFLSPAEQLVLSAYQDMTRGI